MHEAIAPSRSACFLAERLGVASAEIARRIPLLMIGGTAGLMSPHLTVFCRRSGTVATGRQPDPTVAQRALAVGTATSGPVRDTDLGRKAQVEAACATVLAAMRDAGLDHPDDVVCVEIKCPNGDGSDPSTGPRSRGAAALGAAIALGEIAREEVDDETILRDPSLHTSRASASSGTELTDIKVIVIGNRTGAPGNLLAGGGVMQDALDISGAHDAFRGAGLPPCRWHGARRGPPSCRGGLRQCRCGLSPDLPQPSSHHALGRAGPVFRPSRQGRGPCPGRRYRRDPSRPRQCPEPNIRGRPAGISSASSHATTWEHGHDRSTESRTCDLAPHPCS